MMAFVPLWAAGDDLFGIIVFVVIILISVISQVVGSQKQAKQQRPRPRPRPPVRPAQAAPKPRDPVARELDDFLRRAGGKKPAAPQRPVVAQPVGPTRRAAPVARPVLAEPIVELEEVEVESVAEHVSHSIAEPRERQIGSQLGQDVASSGARVDARMSQTFDHKVGNLEGTPGESAQAVPMAQPESPEDQTGDLPVTAAAGLAAMLTSPTSLRQAILLSEILDRPEHRWS